MLIEMMVAGGTLSFISTLVFARSLLKQEADREREEKQRSLPAEPPVLSMLKNVRARRAGIERQLTDAVYHCTIAPSHTKSSFEPLLASLREEIRRYDKEELKLIEMAQGPVHRDPGTSSG